MEGPAIRRITTASLFSAPIVRARLLAPVLAAIVAAGLLFVPPAPTQAQPGMVPAALVTPYDVLGNYPHDRRAFLQGWVWYDGGFYESTGLNGESTLRRVAFPSGEVTQKIDVPREYFAEGLAMIGDRLIQLTWRNKKAFVYDRASFGLVGDFAYETEGWGLTYDGASLIMSDGSSTLFFLDPDSHQVTRTVDVTVDGHPQASLNELEWVKGEVWANVWHTDWILRIDPATGQVIGALDMTGLLPGPRGDADDVLNGIAYDADGDHLYVSGKRWPLLFEIKTRQ